MSDTNYPPFTVMPFEPVDNGMRYQPCCDQLASLVATKQIEFNDGRWNMNGCCGGGCWVAVDLKFCPFCGQQLAKPVTCPNPSPTSTTSSAPG